MTGVQTCALPISKGDTYYPVVILADGVTTDKISGMEGEKYTLTFTIPTGKEIVSGLKINYEDVDIENIVYGETITYTGVFGSTDNGAVIVQAGYGSFEDYGDSLLNKHLAEIFAKDNQIKVDEITDLIKYPDGFIASQYFASSTGAQVAKEKADTDSNNAFKG